MIVRHIFAFFVVLMAALPFAARAATNVTTQVVISIFPGAPTNLAASVAGVQVSLSWTDNANNETAFRIERKTGAGAFTALATTTANIVSYVDNAVAAGTSYTYRVFAYNANGDSDPSNEASAAIAPAPPSGPPPPSGGSVQLASAAARVTARGMAYPGGTVALLRDSSVVAESVVGPSGAFEITVSGLSGGTYMFGVRARDVFGGIPPAQMFSIDLSSGAAAIVTGIAFPPTIHADVLEVRRGTAVTFRGQTFPGGEIVLSSSPSGPGGGRVSADEQGFWSRVVSTENVPDGAYAFVAETLFEGRTLSSGPYGLLVGDRTLPADGQCGTNIRGDENADCRVNIVDFSIMAYWYRRPNPPAGIDLDGSGKVDLVDLSILAHAWTG